MKHNQQQRDAAERVGAAFLSIAQHVKADDAAGADRALAAARAAVTRYRELTRGDDAAAADLAAMELTLEQATVLVREARQRTAPVPAAPR